VPLSHSFAETRVSEPVEHHHKLAGLFCVPLVGQFAIGMFGIECCVDGVQGAKSVANRQAAHQNAASGGCESPIQFGRYVAGFHDATPNKSIAARAALTMPTPARLAKTTPKMPSLINVQMFCLRMFVPRFAALLPLFEISRQWPCGHEGGEEGKRHKHVLHFHFASPATFFRRHAQGVPASHEGGEADGKLQKRFCHAALQHGSTGPVLWLQAKVLGTAHAASARKNGTDHRQAGGTSAQAYGHCRRGHTADI
jgi:hypothetical protein